MSSVRTNLRNGLKACVQEMTTAGGYNFTYTQVFDPPINMEQMTVYPTVNILYGQERRQNNRYRSGNDAVFDLLLPVQFNVFINENNNISLAQDKVLADFQKYFGNNYYVKPATGSRTLFEIAYLSCVVWGTEREVPNCGLSIDFEAYYSIRVNNPDLMI